MALTKQASAQLAVIANDATKTGTPVKTTVRDKSTAQTPNDTALVVTERPDVGLTNVPAAIELLEKILKELQVMNLYIREGMNLPDSSV